MNHLLRRSLLLTIVLLVSPFIHATQNQEVLNWSEQTLLKTFSINYNNKSFVQIKKNYSFNAWSGMVNFLGEAMQTIATKKLILHPTLSKDSILLNSGRASGIQFWRVEVGIEVPELYSSLDFTLVVLASNPNSDSPYIIHSLNIRVTPN